MGQHRWHFSSLNDSVLSVSVSRSSLHVWRNAMFVLHQTDTRGCWPPSPPTASINLCGTYVFGLYWSRQQFAAPYPSAITDNKMSTGNEKSSGFLFCQVWATITACSISAFTLALCLLESATSLMPLNRMAAYPTSPHIHKSIHTNIHKDTPCKWSSFFFPSLWLIVLRTSC